jgi:hypothetical protein
MTEIGAGHKLIPLCCYARGGIGSAANEALVVFETNRAPSLRSGFQKKLFLLINHAALHHERRVLQKRDIFRRIAIDCNDVGKFARLQ